MVPIVCQQNMLFILLFINPTLAVSKALFSYPRPNSNNAFIDKVSPWSGCFSNNSSACFNPFL